MTQRIVRYREGEPAMFAGTRTPVYHVVAAERAGATAAKLAELFPRLTVADLQAARAYAVQHPEELAQDLRNAREQSEQDDG